MYSGRSVTSMPSRNTSPESTCNVPAVALSMVDLPAPLPPMTVTNSPSRSVRLRPFRAVFALTVPGLKVLCRSFSSSMLLHSFLGGVLGLGLAAGLFQIQIGQRQEDRHDQRGDQLQVVSVQADLKHDL